MGSVGLERGCPTPRRGEDHKVRMEGAMTAAARLAAMAVGATLLGALPAHAQKAQDTLRVAYTDPIASTIDYFDPKPETTAVERSIFSTLIVFDPATKTFKPDLAQSWKRIDPTTLEFTLRKGVKWQDGTPVTADDVVYTVNWLLDPKTKLRFGYVYTTRFTKAEKVNDDTVRIYEKSPVSDDLMIIGGNLVILPKHLFEKYDNKADFGRQHPVGTGPYKLMSISASDGIVLKKWEGFDSPGPWRPAASIGTVKILPIPDIQTEVAQLMVGGLDLMHSVPRDQAKQISSNPAYQMTVAPGLNVFYLNFDAKGRAGQKALTDVRVRKAIEMAIDRKALAQNVAPPGAVVRDALCVPVMAGCHVDNAPPAFDPAAAKKLMAEAGYAEGFDVDLISQPGCEQMSEAIAGELREIGVRARVEHLTFGGFASRQRAGKIQLVIGQWDGAGRPDVASGVSYLWGGTPVDYAQDPQIVKLGAEGQSERDTAKRDAIYRKVFDLVNERAYLMPLTSFPSVFVHTKDVSVETDTVGALSIDFFRLKWN